MEEGRAHEEVALAAAPRGRRLARPVFLAAVALALLAFAVIVSGPEVSSALRRARLDREAKERVPLLEARRRLGGPSDVALAPARRSTSRAPSLPARR